MIGKLIFLCLISSLTSSSFADSKRSKLQNDPLLKYRHLTNPEIWGNKKEKNGFIIMSRRIEGTGLLGFWIRGVLDASAESLLTILREVESSEDWTPNLKKKITIKEVSDLEATTYSVNNLPWPAWDRDMILHNKLYLDLKTKLLFVLTKSIDHEKYPPKEDLVRAHVEYSNLGIRPIEKNKSYVEMMIYADPKGSIPDFIVNFFQRSYPVSFLKAMEKRAKVTPVKLRPGIAKLLQTLKKSLKKDKASISKN